MIFVGMALMERYGSLIVDMDDGRMALEGARAIAAEDSELVAGARALAAVPPEERAAAREERLRAQAARIRAREAERRELMAAAQRNQRALDV